MKRAINLIIHTIKEAVAVAARPHLAIVTLTKMTMTIITNRIITEIILVILVIQLITTDQVIIIMVSQHSIATIVRAAIVIMLIMDKTLAIAITKATSEIQQITTEVTIKIITAIDQIVIPLETQKLVAMVVRQILKKFLH